MSKQPKKIDLVFIGGKRAPGTPYIKGQIYQLVPRYARFPWFNVATGQDIANAKIAKAPKPDLTPQKTKSDFNKAFASQLEGQGLGESKDLHIKDDTPEAPQTEAPRKEELEIDVPIVTENKEDVQAPLETNPKLNKTQLDNMTKEQIVSYIQSKNGVADMSMLKSLLIETALNQK